MKKMRFFTLALIAIVALSLATALIWNGCSNSGTNITQPNDITMVPMEKLAPVMAIQDRHTDDLMKINGVVGTGTSVDENGNPVIRVFTSTPNALAKAAVQLIPDRIEGVPVTVEETGDFKAMALSGRYRPVPIGVSVGNNNECAAGTIGCVVYKNGQKYILSNNHVLARENAASIGEVIVQPGRYDSQPQCADQSSTNRVGVLSDFEPIKFGGQNNTYDAAIAKYDASVATSCATPSAYYGFPGTTVVNATVGMRIQKVGRTTSKTTGTVASINVTVNVGYTGGTARFVGQIMTSRNFDKAGDSGSLVVTNDANKNLVALLFAGTNTGVAVVSPIGPVLSRFGATVCNN